jgi:predicted lipoprotein with Yx(FWY)xxD motif
VRVPLGARLPGAALGCAALALAAAGCGSSSNSSTSTPASTAAAASTASTASTPTTASTEPGVVITTKHSKHGTILAAGPKRLTVYMFEADHGGASSACSGECAKAWPPVTTGAAATATGAAMSADLGRFTRSDGTTQVTYKGHPLYFFSEDKDDGDAYGQGSKAFGAGWYVLNPDGAKVDDDAGSKSSGAS